MEIIQRLFAILKNVPKGPKELGCSNLQGRDGDC